MANTNFNFLEVPQNLVSYITDKNKSSKSYFKYLLARTQMMFKYTNLPETIDPNILERMLQVNGVACITEAAIDNVEPSLYCFSGSYGGKLDEYYRPTEFVVSNPHLGKEGFSKRVVINGTEEHTGVLMFNDSEWQGLTPLIARYASLMTENVLTVRVADIMLRKMDTIVASTDKTKKSAEVFLKKLENGELAALSDSAFQESIKPLPSSNYNGSYIIQFIELQQYLKGSFYNELGLRANYNMKREAIGEGESTLDADSVLPLCENMLSSRRKAIAELNDLFGLNVSVDYNSAWLENHIDSYLSIYNKIAESVASMHAQQSTSINGVAQATEGEENGNVTGNASTDTKQSSDTQQMLSTDELRGNNAEERTSADVTETSESDAPGEERMDSGSGVGRELEGTGQDEELIELEEVVEKMIDNVYDEVVAQATTQPDSGRVGGESENGETNESQGLVGGDSEESQGQEDDSNKNDEKKGDD